MMNDPRNSSKAKRPAGAEGRIEALLRATGPRPAVPTDRAERAKSAVRAHWRAEVDRRSRRRWFLGAAAVATAATLVILVAVGLMRPPTLSPVATSIGEVDRVLRSSWSRPVDGTASTAPLAPGDAVIVGSELSTDADARLSLRLASGHSLRLDEQTLLRTLTERRFALDRGAIYIDSRGPWGSAARPVEIVTQYGKIRDIGTQFEVRLSGHSLQLRVREGTVSLEAPNETVEVLAGRGLRVDGDGQFESIDAGESGEEWRWITDVAPSMRIAGRTLQEFLDWIARERGLQLRFDDAQLRASASTITLSGSIEGLTLDQALESVLPTCRMTHRLDGDVLFVSALAGSDGLR